MLGRVTFRSQQPLGAFLDRQTSGLAALKQTKEWRKRHRQSAAGALLSGPPNGAGGKEVDRETILLRLAGAAVMAALVAFGWREYALVRGLYDYSTQANDEGITYLTQAANSPWLSRWEKALAYLARAQLYGRKHDYAQTLADTSAALSLNPGYTTAHLTRAGAEILLRDFTSARTDLDAVIASEPANATARQLRG